MLVFFLLSICKKYYNSVLGTMIQSGHAWIWGFSLIHLCRTSCYFQVTREMKLSSSPLAEPLKQIQSLVMKPVLCYQTFWVIAMVESELLAQSIVQSALEQVFILIVRIGTAWFCMKERDYSY